MICVKNSFLISIYKIGSKWRHISPVDAWFVLAPYIRNSDLNNLKSVILQIFNTIIPAFDLDGEKRCMASIYDKEFKYSGWLREGLAQTLVLLGVFGEESKIGGSNA